MMRLILILALLVPAPALAADFQDPPFEETVFRAKVVSIESSGERTLAGVELSESFQRLSVSIIEGPRVGEVLAVENTTGVTLAVGDVFYLHRTPVEGGELFAVGEKDRRGVLGWLALGFVLVTLITAGRAGARALIALAVSFAVILFGLVPLLLSGAPPVLTSVSMAVLILALSMVITHGMNRHMVIALVGSVGALVFAALVAEAAVVLARLSGFASDETVFLNFATSGALDLPALLLGGILIGIVGVLNDVSVSQVHTVAEIHDANKALSRTEVLKRSMRVGQEHMGAVLNTLPLAYAGASLPLLLLFATSDAPALFIINREIFSAEIIRTLAGGIGLLCSGVIATALAVIFLVPSRQHARIGEN